MKLSKRLNSRHLSMIVLGCFLLINGVIACHMELWRDCAQAWLIARDSHLTELMGRLQYEGHPALWYLLLMPFAKLGFPYEGIILISIGLVGVGLWLFLEWAPFSIPAKISCAFSAAFIYYLPVVSRSYALAPPILAFTAICYPQRHRKPVLYACLLVLLSQIHVIFCGLAGMLMLCWTLERLARLRAGQAKWGVSIAAVCMMLASVALLAMLLPGLSQNTAVNDQVDLSAREFCIKMAVGVAETIKTITSIWVYQRGNAAMTLIHIPIYVVMGMFFIVWFLRSKRTAAIAIVAIVWATFLHAFIYPHSVQRGIMVFWMLIFCAWIFVDEQKDKVLKLNKKAKESGVFGKEFLRAVSLLILVVSALTYNKMNFDVSYQVKDDGYYSMSKKVAEYIQTDLPKDALLISDSETKNSAVAAYLPREKMYNAIRGNFIAFATWDESNRVFSENGDLDLLLQELKEKGVDGPFYYLAPYENSEWVQAMEERSNVKLMEAGSWYAQWAEENYRLYQIEE